MEVVERRLLRVLPISIPVRPPRFFARFLIVLDHGE